MNRVGREPGRGFLIGKEQISAMDYRPNDKTHRFTAGDDADEVIVGNAGRDDHVDAHVACRRFGGEVEFSVGLAGRYESANIRDRDAVLFRGRDDEIRIFQRPADGQIEIETTLLRRPTVSEWTYRIGGHKDLHFVHQPELTGQDLLNAGSQRPDDVIDSYAVYHNTRSGHVLGKTNYRGGKAFHIYRPLAIDDRGQREWGKVTIDPLAGKLRVSFNQAWLADARYPVVIDPTLGYTSVGASSWTSYQVNWWLGNFGGVTAGSNGTASQLWFAPAGPGKYKIACYDAVTLGNRLSNSYEELTSTPGVFNSTDISGESLAIVDGNSYYTAICGIEAGPFCGIRYDSGEGGDSAYILYASYPFEMRDPSINMNLSLNRVSLYLEYTEAATATAIDGRILSLASVRGIVGVEPSVDGMVTVVAGVRGRLKVEP
ncbi:hypothetical protein LCGC14_1204870 [marine sediment metagenome]|uniref:Uncharacterized protein n=1 Tax=marine sediment metagenome TaxID=412755 RepID=A0A0F9LFT4_9ZZZZ